MSDTANIERLLAPAIEAMGFELVRVQLTGSFRDQTLQVMVDRQDGAVVTVDDCAEVSHTVSALLDVEDPIASAYTLEVSSPGIDRPLTRAKDFAQFAGHEVRLETRVPVDGRRRFHGILCGIDSDNVVSLDDDKGIRVAMAFGDILKAKLVLTDALIAAASQRSGQAGQTEGALEVLGETATAQAGRLIEKREQGLN